MQMGTSPIPRWPKSWLYAVELEEGLHDHRIRFGWWVMRSSEVVLMSKELGMSLSPIYWRGNLLADEYLSPSSTSKSKEEPQADNRTMVEITPVSLAKKADGLPDKASRKPTESAKEVPQPQQKTQSRPKTQTKPTTKTAAPTPPKAPTEPKVSDEAILAELEKIDLSVPEGKENRDATQPDGRVMRNDRRGRI